MDLPTQQLIDLLTYLLPGFIAAEVLYNLTSNPRPAPFERIIQALIFTIVVQAGIVTIHAGLLWGGEYVEVGVWTDNTRLIWSVTGAVALGLLFARLSNTDKLHSFLRRLGITHQTSFASEWYGALAQNRGYVVLHLVGERRLYGWPEEWPSVPERGHFVMAQVEWLDGDKRIPLTNVEKILVRASDVEMVELMSAAVITESEAQDGR